MFHVTMFMPVGVVLLLAARRFAVPGPVLLDNGTGKKGLVMTLAEIARGIGFGLLVLPPVSLVLSPEPALGAVIVAGCLSAAWFWWSGFVNPVRYREGEEGEIRMRQDALALVRKLNLSMIGIGVALAATAIMAAAMHGGAHV